MASPRSLCSACACRFEPFDFAFACACSPSPSSSSCCCCCCCCCVPLMVCAMACMVVVVMSVRGTPTTPAVGSLRLRRRANTSRFSHARDGCRATRTSCVHSTVNMRRNWRSSSSVRRVMLSARVFGVCTASATTHARVSLPAKYTSWKASRPEMGGSFSARWLRNTGTLSVVVEARDESTASAVAAGGAEVSSTGRPVRQRRAMSGVDLHRAARRRAARTASVVTLGLSTPTGTR